MKSQFRTFSIMLNCLAISAVLLAHAENAAADTLPLLVIVGLAQEASIAAGPDVSVVISGGDPTQLRASLAAINPAAYRAVISFGIAGGLDPALNSGDAIIATKVVSGTNSWMATTSIVSDFASRLGQLRIHMTEGVLAGSDTDSINPAEKAALRASSGAETVDNESHIAAAFAQANGLPFGALRVVSDPASQVLPPAALIPLNPDGSPNIWAILTNIAGDPAQIPQLIQAGLQEESALHVLTKCRRRLDF